MIIQPTQDQIIQYSGGSKAVYFHGKGELFKPVLGNSILPPSKLAFDVQPSNAISTVAISPAIQVQVQNKNGDLVEDATNSITLAINSNPGSGTLSGTLTKSAVAGVATFDDISIDAIGTSYTLDATASGLTKATSSAFNITVVQDSLLAHWKHDEGSGLILHDYKGSNNGVIEAVESEFWNNNGPDGNPVGTYDGVNDYISGIGPGLGFANGESITLMFAYYTAVIDGSADVVISKRQGTNVNYQFYRVPNADEMRFYYTSAGPTNHMYSTTNLNLSANTWYILIFEFIYGTGASAKWYKGLDVVSGTWTLGNGNSAPLGGTTDVRIGNSDAGHYFNGRQGNMFLYSKILSEAEKTQNWNGLKGRYGL